MADNKQIASDILKTVGGSANIAHVTHCMTRLRLTLKDESLSSDDALKAIPGVLGVVHKGGQTQIVIGQNVPKVYAAFCEISDFVTAEPDSEGDVSEKTEKMSLKKLGANILNYMSGSMTPLIPAMITAAMFKTIMVIAGPDMLHLISAESSFYILCDFLYDTFFYFLPIFLGFTAARKLDMNPVMGIFAGAMLIVPDFVAMAGTDVSFNVYGIPAPVNNYSQTILPAILTIWVMSYIEKFFKRHIPDTLSTIFTPFLTMVVTVPISFCLLAPIGSRVGDLIGNGLISFGNVGGFIAVAVIAGLWEFLVMSGMHQVLILFGIANIAQYGVDTLVLTAGGYATWAAFGMALGAFLRLKGKEEKSLALGYFISGILGGVTEPALYGIGFKYKRPFIALAIGGFAGGLYAGITHVGTYVLGATNCLSVLGYVSGGTSNMINGCIAAAISLILTAVLTYLFGFSKEDLAA